MAAHRGSLNVVGTGIQVAAQTAPDAVACIESAQKVFFLEADPLSKHWLMKLNSSVESLHVLYAVGKERSASYEEMVERVLAPVRHGLEVCFVSYGHPGVFAYPMHEAVRRARAEGYRACMLPAISSEDCLFADLGIDPAAGCQTYEATDFLIYRRGFDRRSALVLLQVGAIAEFGYKTDAGVWNRAGLRVLAETLCEQYPANHRAIVYEAACYACCKPVVNPIELAQLPAAGVTPISTLYVPPIDGYRADPEMLARLGL